MKKYLSLLFSIYFLSLNAQNYSVSSYIGDDSKINSSDDLSMYLLEQKAVVTVAGKAFGSDSNIRFSYAASENDLKRAMDLVEESLTELK